MNDALRREVAQRLGLFFCCRCRRRVRSAADLVQRNFASEPGPVDLFCRPCEKWLWEESRRQAQREEQERENARQNEADLIRAQMAPSERSYREACAAMERDLAREQGSWKMGRGF